MFAVVDLSHKNPADNGLHIITIPNSLTRELAIQAYQTPVRGDVISVPGQTSRKRFLKPKFDALIKGEIAAGRMTPGDYSESCEELSF